ncbi:autotransporter outer membrane beta-barrel domain-containing protein [uncultured Pyramidobacter sp.]|uniref:autotransporter family protein n=1 Tax=uncultured Pyramidobacter sp. TaxID=1623495 RepID=UPI002584561F|nr:autotransporter outer membrane beta-barrel domain-containing protein [uncultured Pyramidobacter sp.]
MIRNRKQEIALCRRGLGAKALAASLLLAASSLPALSHDRIAEIGDVNEAPAGSWLFENLSAAGATPPLGGAVLSMTGNVTIAGADGLTFRGNRSGVMDAPASMIPGIGAFIAPLFPQFQFGGGGAVAALGGDVKLSGKILSLEDNSVSVKGTAVSDEIANWALGPVTLTNVAGARSAAMALGGGAAAMGELELDGAEALNLSGNSAQAEGSVAIAAGGAGAARGGAAVLKGSAITVTGNGVLAKGDALDLTAEKLEVAPVVAENLSLTGSVAAAAGGALASLDDQEWGDAATQSLVVTGNSARAEGSVAAALGGAGASVGGVSLAGDTNVSIADNSASAQAASPLKASIEKLEVTGVATVENVALEGSLAVSGGGAATAIMGPATIVSTDGAAELSNNSAAASGGIAAALGGGVLSVMGDASVMGNTNVSVTGNSASAQAATLLKASVEKLDIPGTVTAENIVLEGSLAVSGGGAAAAIMGSAEIVSNSGAVDFSNNSASASGGIAAALGGGALSVMGNVDFYGDQGVTLAGNSASAQVSSPLSLKVGAAELLPGPKKILDGVSLEGSLALAGGGAAFSGGAAYVNGNDGAAALSDNSAAASGALSLAAGGGLAAAGEIEITGKSAALKGNSASAASNGNVALTVEGLDLDDVLPPFPELKLQKGALRLPLAAAVGGAGASVSYIGVTADETVELSGNSASASGGLAGALGGGLAGFGGVYLTGPKGISVTGNAAQATAQNFELLGLEGISVVYDDDADPATPNYKQSLDSLSLRGSLAAALGGGVLGGGTELDAVNEKLVLSGNAAAASGGLAAAAGGGFADFGDTKLAGKTVEMTDNAVSATAEGGLSLEVKGLALDLGFVAPDAKASLALASLKLPVAAALGGAGASIGSIEANAAETIDLSGNSASASGGVAAALGGGLAGLGDIDLIAPQGVSVTNNTAFAKAAGGAELNVEGLELNLPGFLPQPVSLGKLEGHAPIAAAFGGAIAGDGWIETEKLVVSDNAALAQGGLAAAIGGVGKMTVADPGTGNPASAQFRGNRAEALGSEKISLSVAGLKLGLPMLPPELNASLSGSAAAAIGGVGIVNVGALPNGGAILFADNRASADGSLAAALGGATADFSTDNTNYPDEVAFTRNRALARNSAGIPLSIEGDALKELAVNLVGSIDPANEEGLKALANAALNARSIAFAAGGAAFMPEEIYAGREINFVANKAAAEGDLGVALGGAVASFGDVDIISDGNVTFAGNKVSGSTLALGGAVYALGDVDLTAPNGRVAFMSVGDDAVFGGTLTVESETLLGVKGVELIDQKLALSEAGVPDAVAAVFAPAGGAADLTAVDTVVGEKGEPGGLFRVAADTVDLKSDSEAMVLGAGGDGRHYFMTVESPAITGGDAFMASTYRNATVGFDVDGNARHYYLDVKDSKDLVWNGTIDADWDIDTTENWKDGNGAAEKFFNADRVTFDDTAKEYVVDVVDPTVLPGAMTVAGAKDYAFVSTMGAPRLIGTPALALTGSGKTAFANLDVAVTESFTAGAASQLVADGTRTAGGMAVVRGTGSATLNVADGAALMVQKAELNIPYRIVDGFADYGPVMNWHTQPYAGAIFDEAALAYAPEGAWDPITGGYVTLWDEGTVTFSDRFRMESDPAALLSLANTALTLSRSFAGTLNARASSRQNATGDLSRLGRMNFVPDAGAPAADKGVWGSIWYGHSDVDGMTVTGASGSLEQDSTTKSYGATIGGDFTRRGFTTGLAVQLGKYDTDGAYGADADGKFIGVGLYGGFKRGDWEFTGDLGYNWFDTDVTANLSDGSFRADGVKGHVATAGVRANWHLPARGAMQVTPFLGLRFSRYDQDAYDMKGSFVEQKIRSEDSSIDQWTLPLGVRFDWNLKNRGDWELKPSLEIAYVRAFGDTDIDSRLRFLGSGATLPAMDFTAAVTDENSFRTALQLEGKRRNMTLGLNLSGQFSSNQKDLGVGATVRWDF